MSKTINIIGSGFSSLAASAYLAKAGFEVNVFEKNTQLGGRASQFKHDGFSFDMGPTWYWMPDIFERFFSDFDKKPSDYYQLQRLDPAYKIFYSEKDSLTVSGYFDRIIELFEETEADSGEVLKEFIASAKLNYDIAMDELVYRPGNSVSELITTDTLKNVSQFLTTIRSEVKRRFKNQKLIKLLEFPALFLGAKPDNTPAFYKFMNYADFGLGTWYPQGGMHSVVEGMIQLANEFGVTFYTNCEVKSIYIERKAAKGVYTKEGLHKSDAVLSGADYHFTESLLPPHLRMYSEKYWEKRIFAPSALLFYVGFDQKLKNIAHHSLFFDGEFDEHAKDIYDRKVWPENPLFYASFPSITDPSVAPNGKEAGIFLVPIASGLEDTSAFREAYFKEIIERFESVTAQETKILFKKSFCVKDFVKDYNSFKGNAYGLANTLRQTAFLRPKIRSKKVKGLFFTGQLTVPGPGVPPALISGKIAATELVRTLKTSLYETVV